jgi:hypothetical protein
LKPSEHCGEKETLSANAGKVVKVTNIRKVVNNRK